MNDLSNLTRHPDVLYGPHQPELLQDEILADVLEASARRAPEQLALVTAERSLTYRQLDEQADLAASRLIEAGIRPGHIVGLWMPRGIDLLVMQAAIAKAGAAWLPVDEDTPFERLLVCMEDAASPALVTSARMREKLGAQLADAGRPVHLAETLLVPAPPGTVLTRRGAVAGDVPAYVIYTSGSTGKPKGILITQRSICHFLRSENEVLGVRSDDRVYQGFSVAFDMSFEEIWISYLVGATLWLGPKETAGDPEALPRLLAENGVTVLHAVPTLLALFADDVPSLRIINLGGEMCPETRGRALFARRAGTMFNTYGPTEATVSASLARHCVRASRSRSAMPLPNYGLLVIAPGNTARQGSRSAAARRDGRVVHHRSRPVRGLPRPPRPDGRKIPAQSMGRAVRTTRACTAPATWRASSRTVRSCAWAAPTTRSRSAGSASNWARSKPCWPSRTASAPSAVLLRKDDGIDRLVGYLVPNAGRDRRGSLPRPRCAKPCPAACRRTWCRAASSAWT